MRALRSGRRALRRRSLCGRPPRRPSTCVRPASISSAWRTTISWTSVRQVSIRPSRFCGNKAFASSAPAARHPQRGYEIIERKGLKVGFLAYHEMDAGSSQDEALVNRMDRSTILGQIADLKRQCDVVVVSLHWGIEYIHYPSPGQIQLGAISFATAPHWCSAITLTWSRGSSGSERGLIAYSLGSFQFEPRREEARHSFILRARISARGVEDYKVIPAHVGEGDRPRLIQGASPAGDAAIHRADRRAHQRQARITDKWWFERGRRHVSAQQSASMGSEDQKVRHQAPRAMRAMARVPLHDQMLLGVPEGPGQSA